MCFFSSVDFQYLLLLLLLAVGQNAILLLLEYSTSPRDSFGCSFVLLVSLKQKKERKQGTRNGRQRTGEYTKHTHARRRCRRHEVLVGPTQRTFQVLLTSFTLP